LLNVIYQPIAKRKTLQDSAATRRLLWAMNASRGVLLVALALLAIAALRDVARLGDALPWRQLYDFGDFYCAGAALDEARDPYRYEPLHRCEHAVNATPAYRNDPARVVPAPLPPYDFPPFMLAARLAFSTARLVDAIVIVAAILMTIWGLAIAGVTLDVAALALAFPAGYVLLAAGQVVPFALLALVFSGASLARGHARGAGVLAALTLVEPHLGLPVAVATLVWVPRSRLPLVACTLVLASAAALLVGFPGLREYASGVLPGQASAEIGYAYQYSLTYLLRALGAAPRLALFAGELSYFAMLAAGVWLGGRTAAVLGRRELTVYLPAACSVVAGPYVHMVDLAFALPAALVLADTLHGRPRMLAIFAVCALAVAWIPVWIAKRLFLATLVVVAALLWRLRAPAAFAIATFAAVAAAIYLLELAPPAPLVAVTPAIFSPTDLAQSAWRAYVERLGTPGPLWFVVKLPTWAALCSLLIAAASAVRSKRGVTET